MIRTSLHRNTTTGRVLEQMVRPALERGGYFLRERVYIGERFGGGKHFVDVVAEKNDKRYLISLKWQQVQGTAEQKVPFEVMCLADAVEKGNYERAYLVLGGKGWKLREFYVKGGLWRYLREEVKEKVRILTLEDFIAIANKGEL